MEVLKNNEEICRAIDKYKAIQKEPLAKEAILA